MTRESQFISVYAELLNQFALINQAQGKSYFGNLKHSEIEMIALIGDLKDPNVTELAAKSNMTRGGVTKLVNKLIEKTFIEDYQSEVNQKTRLLRLTQTGKDIYTKHHEFLDRINERDASIFNSLTDEDFQTIISFGEKLTDHLNDLN
ncbi:MarR family transcriptional regulator [Weissella minor]|uniref:MarR family winged helix-turn-helix transcriptional regulator n=1 Tax=Weissella minor TaxID=1620 RepID=UPI001BAFFDFE|nr:MarR family transcriptional regulator [Weissella minor]MBS0950163.1 MarR family transcriptional regulator [Weissella minor]